MYKNGPCQDINPHAIASLRGHTKNVNALTILPDGRLASASDDQSIKLWNVSTGECEATLLGHESAVNTLTVLSDGRLASGASNPSSVKKIGTIKLWNVLTISCEVTLKEKLCGVIGLAALPDGLLASAYTYNIRIWKVSTGNCEAKLHVETKQVKCSDGTWGPPPNPIRMLSLIALPDGRVACGSDDKLIRLWGRNSGYLFANSWSCQMTLSGHMSFVDALTVLSNGCLVSGSGEYSGYTSDTNNVSEIKFWNLSTGACVSTLKKEDSSSVQALMSLPDGRLASGSHNELNIWNVRTGVCEATLKPGASPLVLLPNGQLASGSRDTGYSIKLWDISLGYRSAQEAVSNEIPNHILKLSNTQRNVRYEAARTLANFAKNAANQEAIANAGGIAPLVRLLGDADTDVRQQAAAALCHLAQNVINKNSIAKAGGIAPLVRLLENTNAVVRKNAAGALANLAQYNIANQEIIVKANAFPLLERLLETTGDTDTKRYVKLVLDACRQAMEKNRQTKAPVTPAVNLNVSLKKAPASAPIYSDPFTEFEDFFSAPASSKTTVKASADWTSDFATVAPPVKASTDWTSDFATVVPPLPPAKAIIPSLANMQISSTLTMIPWHVLVIQRELGRGGFGVVCEALWQGTRVAIKQLIGQLTSALLSEFRSETEVHARLRHTNIIALYGVCIEPMKYALVMEFMANGSLFDVLKSARELSWSLRLNLALDMTSGLLYLHTQHIIHRDLKSLNILVDEHMRAKIADFGLAKIKLSTASMTKGGGGTPHWMAPELFDETVNSPATDVYATSIILWEIAARKLPYEGKNASQIMRTVEKGHREAIPAGTPSQFGMLISRCWAQRAEDRPAIDVVARNIREIQVSSSNTSSSSTPASVDSGYAQFSRR